MPFSIQLARSADSHEIAVLLRRSIIELCSDDHGDDPERYQSWLKNKTPEQVERWIHGPGRMFAASDETNRVLGVASGSPDGHVLLNYVLPEARGIGVSKSLMRALEDYFADCGLDEIQLKSTRTAQRLYRSLGYKETEVVDTREGMTFYAYSKDI